MGNEVTTRQAGAVVDFGEYAGTGFENVSDRDQKVPFINILQGQSKLVLADGSTLRAGQLYNTVTGESIDGKVGIYTIPAFITHAFARFRPDQEGFAGQLEINDPIVVAAKKRHVALGLPTRENGDPLGKLFVAYTDDGAPAGDELVETRYVYNVMCDENKTPVGYGIVAFKSTDTGEFTRYFGTHLKNFCRAQKCPIFALPTRITAVLKKHGKGPCYNFVCSPADAATMSENMIRDLSDPRFLAGAALMGLVKAGQVKADFGNADGGEKTQSDDIPF